jgi:hypothetical protein
MKLILLFIVAIIALSCDKDNNSRERCWTCDVYVASTGASYRKTVCTQDGSYPTNLTDSLGNAQSGHCY